MRGLGECDIVHGIDARIDYGFWLIFAAAGNLVINLLMAFKDGVHIIYIKNKRRIAFAVLRKQREHTTDAVSEYSSLSEGSTSSSEESCSESERSSPPPKEIEGPIAVKPKIIGVSASVLNKTDSRKA